LFKKVSGGINLPQERRHPPISSQTSDRSAKMNWNLPVGKRDLQKQDTLCKSRKMIHLKDGEPTYDLHP